jgi:small subunit ribosomal protein S6
MRSYELMTIHRSDLSEEQVRRAVAGIEESMKARGVDVRETEFWGKRRFAYEIDHMREGFYSVFSLRAEPGSLDEIDRALGLSDEVVRHKFVRLDRPVSHPPDTKSPSIESTREESE